MNVPSFAAGDSDAPRSNPALAPIRDVRFRAEEKAVSDCIWRLLGRQPDFPRLRFQIGLTWTAKGASASRSNAPKTATLKTMACGPMAETDGFYCFDFFLISLDEDGWKEENGTFSSSAMTSTMRITMPVFGSSLGELPIGECTDAFRAAPP